MVIFLLNKIYLQISNFMPNSHLALFSSNSFLLFFFSKFNVIDKQDVVKIQYFALHNTVQKIYLCIVNRKYGY